MKRLEEVSSSLKMYMVPSVSVAGSLIWPTLVSEKMASSSGWLFSYGANQPRSPAMSFELGSSLYALASVAQLAPGLTSAARAALAFASAAAHWAAVAFDWSAAPG